MMVWLSRQRGYGDEAKGETCARAEARSDTHVQKGTLTDPHMPKHVGEHGHHLHMWSVQQTCKVHTLKRHDLQNVHTHTYRLKYTLTDM